MASPEQLAEAQRLGVPVEFEDERAGIRFVLIPGGSFQMGSSEDELGRWPWEGPQHRVTLPAYYLSVTEVTNGQYRRKEASHASSLDDGDTHPVTGVSWEEARAYASWAGCTLPTEAQWEYACRAGTTTRWSHGADEAGLDAVAWYYANSGDTTHPVAQKRANAWGLYDMHGNVWEWCEDDWHRSYDGAPTDGRAWVDSPRAGQRVPRGGAWNSAARFLRSALRGRGVPAGRFDPLGFRLARAVTAP